MALYHQLKSPSTVIEYRSVSEWKGVVVISNSDSLEAAPSYRPRQLPSLPRPKFASAWRSNSATTGSEGKWCDASTNQQNVNSARCSFVARDKSLKTVAEMAALLVLVAVTVVGITQGLPQCRDEDNNTVDW